MSNFMNRIFRAVKLDTSLFEEIEADKGAMGQAIGVVVLSSVATGLGGVYKGAMGIVVGIILALVSWYVWAYLTYFIGTRFLPEPQTKADHGELLRTIGFASAPGIFRVLGIIPEIRGIVFWVTTIWMLIAMVIAVRQALDYSSTFRAVGVCLIGWVVQAIILLLLSFMLGGGKPG
jgi:hypothetical protein